MSFKVEECCPVIFVLLIQDQLFWVNPFFALLQVSIVIEHGEIIDESAGVVEFFLAIPELSLVMVFMKDDS